MIFKERKNTKKGNKNDECYTFYEDIEKEVSFY
jgi:hypothetical protein